MIEWLLVWLLSDLYRNRPGTYIPKTRKRYRDYDKTKMTLAFNAVVTGKMNTRKAALEFGVPPTTLYDKIRELRKDCWQNV